MTFEERIDATGHENVSADHDSTLEVTTERFLTPAGDCIVGVGADRAPADFEEPFVRTAKDESATIELTLSAGEQTTSITGRGDPTLTFEDPVSMVARTSTYVDDRTIMVEADRAATDLDRDLVALLADGADLTVGLTVSE